MLSFNNSDFTYIIKLMFDIYRLSILEFSNYNNSSIEHYEKKE